MIIGIPPVTAQENGFDPNADLSVLWAQVQREPENIGLACIPVNNPGVGVYHNIDTAFPLASVGKVLVFIAYLDMLEQGRIPLGETVTVNALDRFDLPRTNANAHERFLNNYPEGTQQISLFDVATEGMLQYSSNAATDYLLQRLGDYNWGTLYNRLGLTNTRAPHPLMLIPLMMGNHDTGQPTMSDIQNPALFVESQLLYSQYLRDPQWREAEIDYRNQRRRGFPPWSIQSAVLHEHTMTGTVRDFATLMLRIYSPGGTLNEDTKKAIRYALRWRDYQDIDAAYIEYGSKLGFYSGGTQTLVAYGDPVDGEPVIAVIFLRKLSRPTYFSLLRSDSIQNLAHWMITNKCAGIIAETRLKPSA